MLGKKKDEEKYRFFGGFVDPKDTSYLQAAIRELKEECPDLTIRVSYRELGSFKVDDWRYRGSKNSIMTSVFLFFTEYYQIYKGGDDIEKTKWFKREDVPENLTEEHLLIWNKVKYHI